MEKLSKIVYMIFIAFISLLLICSIVDIFYEVQYPFYSFTAIYVVFSLILCYLVHKVIAVRNFKKLTGRLLLISSVLFLVLLYIVIDTPVINMILSFTKKNPLLYPTVSGYMSGVLYTALVVGICYIINKYELSYKYKHTYIILSLMVIGLILRLSYCLFTHPTPISDYDTMYYGAKLFANGENPFYLHSYFHRFPHMTMFTLANGYLFKIFGINLFVTQAVSSVLSVVCIYIIYRTGAKLFDKKAGIIAATIYTFMPSSVAYCAVFTSENFAMPFLILSMYMVISAYKATDKKKIIYYMLSAGALLSVGCLFRGVWTFYLAAYIVSVVLLFAKKTKLVSVISLVVAYFVITQIAGSILYHTKITDYKMNQSAVPYSVYVLVGLNFDTYGMFSAEDQNIYFEVNQDKDEMNRVVIERIKQRIVENPEKIIPHMLIKTVIIYGRGEFNSIYWSYEDNGNVGLKPGLHAFYKISAIYHFAMLMAIMYVIIKKKYMLKLLIPALLILGFEAGLMLMEVQARYTYSAAFAFVLIACAVFYKDKPFLMEEEENNSK